MSRLIFGLLRRILGSAFSHQTINLAGSLINRFDPLAGNLHRTEEPEDRAQTHERNYAERNSPKHEIAVESGARIFGCIRLSSLAARAGIHKQQRNIAIQI